jgi:hypothetical protein
MFTAKQPFYMRFEVLMAVKMSELDFEVCFSETLVSYRQVHTASQTKFNIDSFFCDRYIFNFLKYSTKVFGWFFFA